MSGKSAPKAGEAKGNVDAMGDGVKRVYDSELPVRRKLRIVNGEGPAPLLAH